MGLRRHPQGVRLLLLSTVGKGTHVPSGGDGLRQVNRFVLLDGSVYRLYTLNVDREWCHTLSGHFAL